MILAFPFFITLKIANEILFIFLVEFPFNHGSIVKPFSFLPGQKTVGGILWLEKNEMTY